MIVRTAARLKAALVPSLRPRAGTVTRMRRVGSVLANDSLLLLTAVIWGMAFVAQRMGMDHVGPFTYNAVRFALGSLALVPLILVRGARAELRCPDAAAASRGRPIGAVAAGLIAGVVLVFGASLQQVGLVSTTAGKAGFITGLYVVLVPLSGLLWRQRTGWSAWMGAVLCVAGLFFLSVTAAFTVERGDLFVLIGSFFWAAHVQVVGWLSPRTDPVRLACVQFAVCSLASAGGALLTEQPRAASIAPRPGPSCTAASSPSASPTPCRWWPSAARRPRTPPSSSAWKACSPPSAAASSSASGWVRAARWGAPSCSPA